jgi:hypothetical protein
MKAETYTLTASNGRKIRTATQVVLSNGRVIRFTERLTKREAIKCAQYQLEREARG